MIRYEVTLECSAVTAAALERWMRNTHIPGMLATECFAAIHFDRAQDRFRTVYQASTQEHLDRYLRDHAGPMRSAFHERFPEGVAIAREVWEQVQSWTSA